MPLQLDSEVLESRTIADTFNVRVALSESVSRKNTRVLRNGTTDLRNILEVSIAVRNAVLTQLV